MAGFDLPAKRTKEPGVFVSRDRGKSKTRGPFFVPDPFFVPIELKTMKIGRMSVVVLALLMLSSGSSQAGEKKLLWLAVGSAELTEPLNALADKRRSEGFETRVSNKSVEESLAASPRRPDFLLLVGDDEPGREKSPWFLPAKRKKLYRWRSVQRQDFCSDAAWGDLDGDGVPDIPVGRIPAHTRDQVELVVQKILAFESQPPTAADLRLTVWLGSPDYNATINALASALGVSLIQTNGPPWLHPWLVSGNPSDPFCGWPPNQPMRFTKQMKQGGILSVLMGHASADAFYSMRFADKPIFYTTDDAAQRTRQGASRAPHGLFFLRVRELYDKALPSQISSVLSRWAGSHHWSDDGVAPVDQLLLRCVSADGPRWSREAAWDDLAQCPEEGEPNARLPHGNDAS